MFFKKRRRNIKHYDGVMFNEKADNNIDLTTQSLKAVLMKSNDVTFKDIYINANDQLQATLLYVDGMVNTKTVSDDIIKPLMEEKRLGQAKNTKEIIDLIEHGAVYFASHKTRTEINDCINDVINGSVALVFDKENTAICFDVKGFEKRSITEPSGENVLKGSKDSFVETLRVNTATVRRKIRTPNLRIKETVVGKQTKTPIAIIYIEGITDRNIVDEVKDRLDNIEIDEVISAGHIEEYIIDSRHSTFPQIAATERPDKFCANIASGRVGVIIDGLPITYIIPATVTQFLQAPEDYSINFWMGSFVRLLRYVLMFISLFLPGIYISVTTFHHEMIPTELALSIAASKAGVPFPAFIEIILMLIAFEVLLEAGLRLPRTIGQAVSIIGALVVGEAAVNARLVSPAVVIVVAATGIASFAMPNQDFSYTLRLWRFVMVVFSSAAGLFGLTIGALLMLFRMCVIESFGVPYISPFTAGEGKELMDTLVRFPLHLNKSRPSELSVKNKRRQK